MADTAPQRLGLIATLGHLNGARFHVDGHDNSVGEPDVQTIHTTHGYRQDRQPDLDQVMLELTGEHQAGIPVLVIPLSGKSRDARAFGQGNGVYATAGPSRDISQSKRSSSAGPDRALGLPVLCGNSSAAPPGAMAHGPLSHSGASAPAATAWPALYVVL